MVAVLDAWKDLMPAWMLTHVLEQLVFPKLQAEVDAWNPLTDTVPIHAWIHPWLPLMGWYYYYYYTLFLSFSLCVYLKRPLFQVNVG